MKRFSPFLYIIQIVGFCHLEIAWGHVIDGIPFFLLVCQSFGLAHGISHKNEENHTIDFLTFWQDWDQKHAFGSALRCMNVREKNGDSKGNSGLSKGNTCIHALVRILLCLGFIHVASGSSDSWFERGQLG